MALDQSSIRLEACTISGCKGPAVDLTNQARLQAGKCTFRDCAGEMWTCMVHVHKSSLIHVVCILVDIHDQEMLVPVYTGAVWVWDDASADVEDCRLQADKTYVVLADGKAIANLQASYCLGSCYK